MVTVILFIMINKVVLGKVEEFSGRVADFSCTKNYGIDFIKSLLGGAKVLGSF